MKSPRARGLQPSQVAQGDGRHHQGLGCQTRERVHPSAQVLLDQPVEAEGQRQPERYPRQRALHHHQDRHGSRENDGRALGPAQSLAQEDRREGHRHERVDEVPESRVRGAPRVDAVDVDEPVGAHQHARHSEPADQGRGRHHGAQLAPPSSRGHQEGAGHQCPHDAVADDLHRPGGRQQVEVQGEDSPQQVAAQYHDHAGSRAEAGGRRRPPAGRRLLLAGHGGAVRRQQGGHARARSYRAGAPMLAPAPRRAHGCPRRARRSAERGIL